MVRIRNCPHHDVVRIRNCPHHDVVRIRNYPHHSNIFDNGFFCTIELNNSVIDALWDQYIEW